MKDDYRVVLYKNKAECCGCGACSSVCIKEAIKMMEDDEGFYYPRISYDRCIGCKACVSVCPMKM